MKEEEGRGGRKESVAIFMSFMPPQKERGARRGARGGIYSFLGQIL